MLKSIHINDRHAPEPQSLILRELQSDPTRPISLYVIGRPLVPQGFSEDEIVNALFSLQQDGEIELLAGNRLR
ncbi:hypothetical protein AJ87_14745 [Rhizobium yanglingense]|nr:hypothetical protein AJ87_14745 [Rhizobium yanglingense]